MYKLAIELEPVYGKAYHNIGSLYASLGRYQEAIDYLNKSLEINPGYALSYMNLAAVYYQLAEYDKAVEYADQAVGLGHEGDTAFLEKLKPHRQNGD